MERDRIFLTRRNIKILTAGYIKRVYYEKRNENIEYTAKITIHHNIEKMNIIGTHPSDTYTTRPIKLEN